MDMKIFRNYIITSLAVGMLIIFWVFCIDAIFNNMWSNFKVIVSIVIFAFLLCLIQNIIAFQLSNRPIISLFVEYVIVVVLFFVFGIKFKWYPRGSELLVFIYTIPVYAAGYFLRLIGVKRDEEYINNKLLEKKALNIQKYK